jgi:hypothetical protein
MLEFAFALGKVVAGTPAPAVAMATVESAAAAAIPAPLMSTSRRDRMVWEVGFCVDISFLSYWIEIEDRLCAYH